MKIKYADYLKKTALTKVELLAFANGALIEDCPFSELAALPLPPMLMFDRITEIAHNGNRGRIVAEQDIALDDWFFQCHFRSDPVQPGCLGLDAVWQLLGLYASLRGAEGVGRALGVKEVEFFGQVRPYNKLVRYDIAIRRYTAIPSRGAAFVIGSASVLVDDVPIYTINDAKVGVFTGIQYADYPHKSNHAVGGLISST